MKINGKRPEPSSGAEPARPGRGAKILAAAWGFFLVFLVIQIPVGFVVLTWMLWRWIVSLGG